MTRLIYHPVNESQLENSPFETVIRGMASSKTLKIACPYLSYGRLTRIVQGHTNWKLLTDVEALFRSLRRTDRLSFIALFREKRDRVRHEDLLHAKVVIAERQALVGSANLTDMGLDRRVEMSVLITDQELVNELDLWFEGIWKAREQFSDNHFAEMERFANQDLPDSSSADREKGKLSLRWDRKKNKSGDTGSKGARGGEQAKKNGAQPQGGGKRFVVGQVPQYYPGKPIPRGNRRVQIGKRVVSFPAKVAAQLAVLQKSRRALNKTHIIVELCEYGFRFGNIPISADSPGHVGKKNFDALREHGLVDVDDSREGGKKMQKCTALGYAAVILDPIGPVGPVN